MAGLYHTFDFVIGLRRRLTDLAATIATDTTWTDLETHIATTSPAGRPPPNSSRASPSWRAR